MTDEELEALLRGLEAGLTTVVQSALTEVAEEFADAVDGATELVAARFSVSRIGSMWRLRVSGLVDVLRRITRQSADTVAEDLGEPLPDEWNESLSVYEEATEELLNAVGDRLAEDATRALADGLNQGDTIDELKGRLTAVFAEDGTKLGPGRAERIAVTESTRAWNAGALAAAQALTGPDRPLVKQWLTRMDNRVRVQHADTNGQLQLLDDAFDVAGTPMQYPGDPTAPADLTVGCRCILRVATAARPAEEDDVTADISAAADGSHTSGAMIALIPTEADAARLALDGGEIADELHLTLFFLGAGANWDGEARADLVSRVADVSRLLQPIQGNAFGVAQWNPQGDEPCWVWNVGHGRDYEGTRLHDAKYEAQWALEDRIFGPDIPAQHEPWSPHICAQYTADDRLADLAARVGPVTFDRIRVTFAGDRHDFQLSAGQYRVGDRVMVAGEPHEAGHAAGTVVEINNGPAYGILFDGTDEVHRWYVGDELMYADEPDPEEVNYALAEAVEEAVPPILTWSTPGDTALAFENQQTGDGRLFTPGALYWSDGPWPLKVQHEEDSTGALAGAIADMRRDGSRIDSHGVLYLTQPGGVEAAMLLSQGAPVGVSVDLDDVDLEFVDATDSSVYSARLITASVLTLPDGAGWTLTGETAAEWTASGASMVGESSKLTLHIGPDGTVPAGAFELSAAAGDTDVVEGVVVDEQKSGQFLTRITRARIRGASLTLIPAFAGARITLDEPAMFASMTAAGKSYTGSTAHDYDRVVRHVGKSLVPVTASDAARNLSLPVASVRRYLARAAKKGSIVRLTRGTYVRPAPEATASARERAAADELSAQGPDYTASLMPDHVFGDELSASAFDAFKDDPAELEGLEENMEASAWSAMASLPAMPAAWFAAPTDAELPPGGPGINYLNGRIFGWVAQAGEPHAGFAKKITIDGLGRIDTSHFLRQRFTLDDGSSVKAGAFTMNVGHHRDGAECETSACQFDDTRTVAGIVTVGMSERGMWFSGAAAPWMSEWDRQVFSACQPSYHMKKGPNGQWQLRAVLSVPVPGHSSPLLASAVIERSQVALTAAATMVEVEEAVAAAETALSAGEAETFELSPVLDALDYDRLADALTAAMARAEDRKAAEAAELEALLAEGRKMDLDTGTEGI